jgi:hypothetical protein
LTSDSNLATTAHTLPVTPDNFVRAETDLQFMTVVKLGGFGRLVHEREFPPAGRQPRAWADADILRSRGVFDLEFGPVEITLPPAGERFVSIEALDEDHYTLSMSYGPGTYSFSFDNVSTRYVLIVVRILVDPASRADMAAAQALQDGIRVARVGRGRFVIPNWDPVSQARVRVALQLLAGTIDDDQRTFGGRGEVDPVRHLVGTATHWDRCPPREIACLLKRPRDDDGNAVYRLHVGHVPVDGFWSLTVYDSNGHFLADSYSARSVNSRTGVRDPDHTMSIQFGGSAESADNCLQIERGWGYVVRLYRPRAEILGGRWKFPDVEVVRPATPLSRSAGRRSPSCTVPADGSKVS